MLGELALDHGYDGHLLNFPKSRGRVIHWHAALMHSAQHRESLKTHADRRAHLMELGRFASLLVDFYQTFRALDVLPLEACQAVDLS